MNSICDFDDFANEIVSFRVDERSSDSCIRRDNMFSFFLHQILFTHSFFVV